MGYMNCSIMVTTVHAIERVCCATSLVLPLNREADPNPQPEDLFPGSMSASVSKHHAIFYRH